MNFLKIKDKIFLDYFEKQYFKNKTFSDKQWNYSNILNNNDNPQKYFYTNNISESLKRILNSF